jgi:hypothetical protein
LETPLARTGAALAPKQDTVERQALLPAIPFEFRIEMLFFRLADAEIGDELPLCRDVEAGGDGGGIEDRDPANAETARPRRKRQILHCADNRIDERFRHRHASEAAPGAWRRFTKDREMARRLAQARQFQPCIESRLVAIVTRERRRVAMVEIIDDRPPPLRRINADETPWLAMADRGREGCEPDKLFDRFGGDGVLPKAPHVAPPAKQIAEQILESGIEDRRRQNLRRMAAGGIRVIIGLQGAWYGGTRHGCLRNGEGRQSEMMEIRAKPIVTAAFRPKMKAQSSKSQQRAQNGDTDPAKGKFDQGGWRGRSGKFIMPALQDATPIKLSKPGADFRYERGADGAPSYRSSDMRG